MGARINESAKPIDLPSAAPAMFGVPPQLGLGLTLSIGFV